MDRQTLRFTRRTVAPILTVFLTCAVVACGAGGEPTTRAGSTAPDPAAAAISGIVATTMAKLRLTGAVYGVWRGDDEVTIGASGESPIGVRATPDMLVRVGQPMEPMLSTVLLQLNEAGTLKLDEPIARWVPDFPRADQITPRMLANATSGISDYVTNPDFLSRFYANPMHRFTAPEILALGTARPPLFPPGTSWAYAHTDLCLLGVVLEKATGRSLGELLTERIFNPLAMTRSKVVLTPNMQPPILHGYTNERGVFEDSTFWNPTAFLNSGNMNAPVADVGRWVRGLATGQLVSPSVFAAQMAPTTAGLGPLTTKRYFAFGTAHLDGWLLLNPSFGGYDGVALYDTATKTAIVVYVSLAPGANANTNNAIPIGNAIGALLVPGHPPNAPT